MKDKSIIINGVDVSKCKYFKNRTCIADYLLTDMDFSEAKCELCKNCYFKQLTLKTQECEGIKKQLDRFKTENKKLKDKAYILFDEAIIERDNFIEELKAENEKLKDEIEACYNQVEDFDIIATSKSNKLKQAEQKLKRIEEYCKEQNLKADWTACEILQKISEVLNDR